MHRTASLNEESARYSKMRGDFYLPEELRQQSTKNRQATEDEGFNPIVWETGYPGPGEKQTATQEIKDHSQEAYEAYENMLEKNVAREQARMILPVNLYTSTVWKMDLHNLLHFLRLRLDSHAQYEIRVFAEAIAEFVKQLCPWTWEAFEKYGLQGQYFTGPELDMIRQWMDMDSMASIDALGELDAISESETPASIQEEYDMSKGELGEFVTKLKNL